MPSIAMAIPHEESVEEQPWLSGEPLAGSGFENETEDDAAEEAETEEQRQ